MVTMPLMRKIFTYRPIDLYLAFKHSLLALGIISLSINIANAGAFQKMDELLLEGGIVDDDYVYFNESLANKAFRDINNAMAALLPIRLNSYTEATSIMFTPYYGSYFYTIDVPLSGESVDAMREYFNDTAVIGNLCDNVYDAKFQTANNFTLSVFFKDTKGELITKVVFDKNTCSRTEVDYSNFFS